MASSKMEKNAVILVTGATGMVGGSLVRTLRDKGFSRVLNPSRAELNLCETASVDSYFHRNRPEYVFLLAAKVGGIAANVADPVGFLSDNLQMAVNGMSACHRFGVQKTLLLGSSCIYPCACPQPMREEYLLTGPPEPTNEGYALAKIAALKLAEYYHRQFGMQVVCPMPCNIYGTGDHFDLQRSHVLSSLVRRFCDARDNGMDAVTLWGTGSARREFIHVDDVVAGMLFQMEHLSTPNIVNLGTGVDVTIRQLAQKISDASGFQGTINWDATKPNGMARKCLDCSQLTSLGFTAQVSLDCGIERTIAEYTDLKDRGSIAA